MARLASARQGVYIFPAVKKKSRKAAMKAARCLHRDRAAFKTYGVRQIEGFARTAAFFDFVAGEITGLRA